MGRVYRIIDLITGNDMLWKNDIAAPNGANNALKWWLWIGGIEYTLPGQEHGYTWALQWNWNIVDQRDNRDDRDDRDNRATRTTTTDDSDNYDVFSDYQYCAEGNLCVVTTVTEPTTGMIETLSFSLSNTSSALSTEIFLYNPSSTETVQYAHWTNVPFVPGPLNTIPDTTEFIIPTQTIHIDKRWQENLGNETQNWKTSPLRYIKNWTNGTKMGDLTSNGLEHGYFGVYSHSNSEDSNTDNSEEEEEEEGRRRKLDVGGLRLFNLTTTPGCDTWTYGYHPPSCFPQYKKIAVGHCRYAEMWGGTVTHLEKVKPLKPKENIHWNEFVLSYRGTRGVTFANNYFVANVWREKEKKEKNNVAVVALSFHQEMSGISVSVEGGYSKSSGGGGVLSDLHYVGDVTPSKVVLVEEYMMYDDDDDNDDERLLANGVKRVLRVLVWSEEGMKVLVGSFAAQV